MFDEFTQPVFVDNVFFFVGLCLFGGFLESKVVVAAPMSTEVVEKVEVKEKESL